MKSKREYETRNAGYLPVLVEATTAFLGQMLSPDVDEGAHAEWSLDVADGTHNNHWWGFQDGHGLNDFLLVDLCNGKGLGYSMIYRL